MELACRQHGVVSIAQLRGLGFTNDAAKYRARTGRLHRLHRGVYAVGHTGLSEQGVWMAAVLAVGGDAVLSHRSAAALWKMLSSPSRFPEVTVPGEGGKRARAGLRLHRSTTLTPADRTRRDNIPVTTPTRTLLDLARVAPAATVAAARRQAEVLGLALDADRLDADPVAATRTRSELEARFLALCRRHRLPAPLVNADVGPYQVDFLWPGHMLAVETDGWESHRGRQAFEADRERAAELARRGYEVMRFSWRQVTESPREVAAALRARLGAGPTRASARPT